MDKRRVVITGLGIVSPIGTGKENYWAGLMKCESAAAPVTAFDASGYSTTFACEVKVFNPDDYIDPKKSRRMDRFVQFAMAAAKMAMDDSFLNVEKEDPYRLGVIVASGIGGLITVEKEEKVLLEKGHRRISPFLIPMMIINMAGGEIAIRWGLRGPNYSVVSACASANHAFGTSLRLIQHGDADVILAGGTEAPITPIGLGGFCSIKALSTRNAEPQRASRPFDKERDGFIMAEGAGILVLEELSHAEKRGAHIYAELAGFGATADAYHITAPSPDGEPAAKTLEFCLRDADVRPGEVDYFNAHGTSTPLNDKGETAAIKKVFGDYAYKMPVSSTKSMTGHMLGAAAGNELIATLLCMQNGIVHPTINYENPDPDCDLDYVPNKPREHKIKTAISNALGFGGHNAAILVKTL